jgi:hypothetical protein
MKVVWMSKIDSRTRPSHWLSPEAQAQMDAEALLPPRPLGMFNCRGEYVPAPGEFDMPDMASLVLERRAAEIAAMPVRRPIDVIVRELDVLDRRRLRGDRA